MKGTIIFEDGEELSYDHIKENGDGTQTLYGLKTVSKVKTMEEKKQHKPGCLANISCMVAHNGPCPGPYGKCTCEGNNTNVCAPQSTLTEKILTGYEQALSASGKFSNVTQLNTDESSTLSEEEKEKLDEELLKSLPPLSRSVYSPSLSGDWREEFDSMFDSAEQIKYKEVARWKLIYGFTPTDLKEFISQVESSATSRVLEKVREKAQKLKRVSIGLILQPEEHELLRQCITIHNQALDEVLKALASLEEKE